MGPLSNQRMRARHSGQRLGGKTRDFSMGERWMTTLRKLPTIAPMAKAKTLSRLKAESYAIAGTRGNVTTRAYFDGGEWGLVASAVFKTVVSARKRRRVGSIPTRLRQAARPPAFVG